MSARRSIPVFIVLVLALFAANAAFALSANIVISQVYGAGGNAGAVRNADYVELFNRGSSPQSLNGWSIQYASATGTGNFGSVSNLPNVTLQPGQYFLLGGTVGANGAALPATDATLNAAMAATAGKVILANTTTAIPCNGGSDPCTAGELAQIIDLVGWGNANFFEGAVAPATSTTLAIFRGSNGCTETDNNSTDFAAAAPAPRNTATTFAPCSGPPMPNLTVTDVTQAEGTGGTTTFTFQVNLSAPAGPGGVTFNIATADGTAQDNNPVAEDDDYVAQSLTGQVIAAGNSSFAFNVTVNPDVIPEVNETFFVNVSTVTGANVTDGQGQGTINNDDVSCASLSINDVTQAETNAGTTTFAFTVSLSQAGCGTVTFDIATADGTAQDDNPATDDNDYVPQSLTGQTVAFGTPYTFNVTVNGDTTPEPNETFFVNITNVSPGNVQVADGQGLGTIVNEDFTRIHDIQGNGTASPLVSQTVTARGIVTLLRSNGFFLQEELADYDADPNTSEGIFVFTSSAPSVAVGHDATVTGTVVEFNGLTEISTSNANVTTNSTGNPLPVAITLTPTDLPPTANFTQPQLEKYEGMRLLAISLTTVAPNDTFFDVYTVLTGQPRPFREPGIPAADPIPPDPTSAMVDPNIPIWDMNPERLSVDTNGRAGSTGETLTSNVTLTNVAGPLDFSFGEYHLINEANLTRGADMSAVPVPTPAANQFTVAGYNIENFNNNATQRQKAALTVRDVLILPDIIGAVEIFDLADLQALATEIQTISGVTYSAHLIEQDGTSEDSDQDLGFLVKTSRVSVTSVTAERAADTYINPNTSMSELLHDRPPLVLRGTVDPSGPNPLPVIVVVNHTRSFIDIELVAGEGVRVRAKRKAQAESLADLLNDLQTDNPTTPVIWVGDYNAFQFNNGYDDPISVLKGMPTPDDQIVVDQSPDLVNPNAYNLLENVPADQRYTFIFEGTPQALDHMLVNPVALALNTGIAVARVNADFPEASAAVYASNAARPERNSDHDPLVGFFQFPSADVSLTKTLTTSGPYFEGQSVSYTINVANAGPVPATNIQVTDTPTNLSITGVSGACASLPCTIASLAAGANTNINVTATIVAPGAFDNSANADADEADPNTANNTDNTTNGGTAGATANVSVSKSLDTAGPYSAGQSVTYTINVANAGPSTATNINVTDTPTNLTITGVSGACAALPCTIASLASGANTNITVTATINAAGAFDNAASAAAAENDPNTANNTDNTGNGDTAAASANVSLTKTLDTAGPWNVGQSVTYTIVVSNAGPSTATTINVTDSPTNLTITGVSGACASLPCTIASLASGASTNITVTATIDSFGSFDNSATATAAEADPNLANNTDNTGNGGTTAPQADVSLSKSLDTAGPWNAGQTVTYTILVANAGPSTATNISVTDTPTNLTITGVSGACASFPCTIASILPSANTSITVTATITASGAFDNSATATPTETDPVLSNNTDNTGNGGATASADVSITKTLTSSGPYQPGSTVTYLIAVSNAGPDPATNIQVTDTPTNLTITGVSDGCTSLPCTIGTLNPTNTQDIHVTATINSTGAFDNSATATPLQFDPITANNTDNTGNGGTTGPRADVSVVKSIVTPEPYKLGQTGVQWQIVVSNAGPDIATNVVVTDTPIGVSFTSVSGAGCTSFPCTIPSLAVGANTTINMTGNINTTGSFDNSATVAAAEFDPNTANNSDLFGNGGVAQNAVDVAITKTLNTAGPYFAGQSITYTLVVSNTGPGVALFVVVTDTPTNLTITSVSGAGCTAFPCTLVPGITPTPASNRTITVVATINAAGPFDNSATATQRASDVDNDPSNNTDNTGNGGTAGVAAGDTDGDGVPDTVEQAAPNGGDGNGDGIADYLQNNVASLPAANGNGYLTLRSSCQLLQVMVTTEGAMATQDPLFEYPVELIAFRAPCSSATFSLFVYGSGAASAYRKFGPLPPGGPQQWYGIPATFTTQSVGSLNPRRIDFSLTDGGTGDDTPVDGVIVDQGGPGQPLPTEAIPTLSEWMLMLMAALLAMVAAVALKR